MPHKDAPGPADFNTLTKAVANQDQPSPQSHEPSSQNPEQQNHSRDPNVLDEAYAQLQCDKRAAEEREQRRRELRAEEKKAQEELKMKAAAELEERRRAEEESNSETHRLLEKERLRCEREWRK